MKLALRHCLDHIRPEDEVAHVRRRNQYPLLSRQPMCPADIEKPLDFLISPTDRLHLSPLIHRAGHGEILAHREFCQTREQSVEFGRRRTVAFNAGIRLLETQTGREGEGLVLTVTVAQIPRENKQSFVMNRAAKTGFPLDVDDTSLTHRDTSRDSRWPAEAVVSHLQNRQPIDLSDLAA